MSKKSNSSLEEKSKDENVSLLSPQEVTDWRSTGAEIRSGTACKCGAHVSNNWADGGEEWFEGHVLEHHVDERKKLITLIFGKVNLSEDQRKEIVACIMADKGSETLTNA